MVVQHLYQAPRVAGLLEDALQPQESVVVAGDQLQNPGRGRRGVRQVGQLLRVDGQHAPKQADLLVVRRCDFYLLKQKRRQVRPAFALFVGLDDIAQGHGIARVDLQNLQVDLGRVLWAIESFGVQMGQAVKDLDLGLG